MKKYKLKKEIMPDTRMWYGACRLRPRGVSVLPLNC